MIFFFFIIKSGNLRISPCRGDRHIISVWFPLIDKYTVNAVPSIKLWRHSLTFFYVREKNGLLFVILFPYSDLACIHGLKCDSELNLSMLGIVKSGAGGWRGNGGGTGAYAALQTTVLHMKKLNQTESPIFVILSVLCFQRQSFFPFILQHTFSSVLFISS